MVPLRDAGWPNTAQLMDCLGKAISQWYSSALLDLSPSLNIGNCVSASRIPCIEELVWRVLFSSRWDLVNVP